MRSAGIPIIRFCVVGMLLISLLILLPASEISRASATTGTAGAESRVTSNPAFHLAQTDPLDIYEPLLGPQVVMEDTRLYGTIRGHVTVSHGVIFDSYGSITGDMIVEPGAVVTIYGSVLGDIEIQAGTLFVFGKVGGDIVNLRGTLSVFGIVHGRLFRKDGETFISPGAVIGE